ncbi:MAG TPA: YetF domain-containing protein, partial [Lysobacter sp.]
SGKRTMGQFTSFDMLLIVLLGNAVQNALLGKDTSMSGGLLLAATLMTLNWMVGFVTARSKRAERLLEGEPVVLARNGHVYRDVLRRELVSRDDLAKAMREAGCSDISHVHLALLETNGHITILMREGEGKAEPGQDDARQGGA